jgi:hypothetical protein
VANVDDKLKDPLAKLDLDSRCGQLPSKLTETRQADVRYTLVWRCD